MIFVTSKSFILNFNALYMLYLSTCVKLTVSLTKLNHFQYILSGNVYIYGT